mmetsp:Transcript_12238/g.25073  ORF Transcript_12238/g.25073 Transcript_12238/m.25073 type:complete len:232 (-) Transcript_12238:1888-2583(-)
MPLPKGEVLSPEGERPNPWSNRNEVIDDNGRYGLSRLALVVNHSLIKESHDLLHNVPRVTSIHGIHRETTDGSLVSSPVPVVGDEILGVKVASEPVHVLNIGRLSVNDDNSNQDFPDGDGEACYRRVLLQCHIIFLPALVNLLPDLAPPRSHALDQPGDVRTELILDVSLNLHVILGEEGVLVEHVKTVTEGAATLGRYRNKVLEQRTLACTAGDRQNTIIAILKLAKGVG